MARATLQSATSRKPRTQPSEPNAKQVRDVMTPDPACCLPSDSAQQAAKIMRDRDTGVVPIVNDTEERKLVGVVTDRDVCLCVVAEGREAATPVQECMTPKIVRCHADDPLDQAIRLMEENQIRRIPVVDSEDRIEGILSIADMIRHDGLADEQACEMLDKISEPTQQASKPRAESERHGATGAPSGRMDNASHQGDGNRTAAVHTISKGDLRQRLERHEPIQVVNVLEPKYYHLGFIRGSKKIPLAQLEQRLRELDPSQEVITYCAGSDCNASRKAAELLSQRGFHVRAYEGGITEWKESGLPTE